MLNIISNAFLCEIVIPDNWVQMIVWYSILVICLVFYIISTKKKRDSSRDTNVKGYIERINEVKACIESDKVPSRKVVYNLVFQLNLLIDNLKETYENSSFVVYSEALDKVKEILKCFKELDRKKWKEEETVKLKDEIRENCDIAISVLEQAL